MTNDTVRDEEANVIQKKLKKKSNERSSIESAALTRNPEPCIRQQGIDTSSSPRPSKTTTRASLASIHEAPLPVTLRRQQHLYNKCA